jgi:hypothetical protein
MKVSELFEAYTPPVKNRALAFRAGGKKVGTGKQGVPIGGTKEWLKSFGADAEHVAQAMRVMKQSSLVKQLQKIGLFDESSERQTKNGSMMFLGSIAVPAGDGKKVKRLKFTVQSNGKIDETAPNDFHRAPVTSKKPHIVPGDPVQSIVKTMSASLEKLLQTMERRRDQESKLMKKLKVH